MLKQKMIKICNLVGNIVVIFAFCLILKASPVLAIYVSGPTEYGMTSLYSVCPDPQIMVGIHHAEVSQPGLWLGGTNMECVTVYGDDWSLAHRYNMTEVTPSVGTTTATCPQGKFLMGDRVTTVKVGFSTQWTHHLQCVDLITESGGRLSWSSSYLADCRTVWGNGGPNPSAYWTVDMWCPAYYSPPALGVGDQTGWTILGVPILASASYTPPLPPPPTVSLSANPAVIYGSGNSTLTWSTTNNPISISSNFSAWPPVGGNRQVTPSQGANYYWVTVSNAGGSASASTYVYVYPGHFSLLNASAAKCDTNQQKPYNEINWNASASASWYNIYRGGTYIGYVYAPTTNYKDYNVSYGGSYTYQVQAVNAQGYGTWSNNTVALNALYCTKPSVTISPITSNITLGQTQTLSWTGTNVSKVDISNYGNVYSGPGISSPGGNITVRPQNKTTYTVTGTNPCPAPYCYPATASATVFVSNTLTNQTGSGDIYSGRELNDPNGKLSFDDRTILSAHDATINMPGSPDTIWQIPNYVSLKEVLWESTKNKMQTNLDNMKKNAVKINFSGGNYLNNFWYLDKGNDTNPSSPTDPNPHIDGKIWEVTGDLNLNSVKFIGKGTIIVDGNLNINGPTLEYSSNSDSAGIIVGSKTNLKNINIKRSVEKAVGAYFTFGTITFE